MAHSYLFKREMFVWADENGSDRRNHIRKFGYALRGRTPEYQRSLSRGCRVNAIAAITSSGLLATELTTGSVNGERLFDFLRGTLIPLMNAFDGQSPNSILVMDNCSIHRIQEVKSLLSQAGIPVMFLPPYSPDLNPIEAFSYIKQCLRHRDELLQTLTDPSDIIRHAVQSITAEHCNSWISHSGYGS